jgi:hypothetical protein
MILTIDSMPQIYYNHLDITAMQDAACYAMKRWALALKALGGRCGITSAGGFLILAGRYED